MTLEWEKHGESESPKDLEAFYMHAAEEFVKDGKETGVGC